MNVHLKRHLIICECMSPEHQFILQYFDDEKPEWQELYMDVHLINYGNIFKNLWTAIRWAFGHKSIYGQFDEVIIAPDEAKKMIEFLQGFVEASKIKNENDADTLEKNEEEEYNRYIEARQK